MYKYSSNVYITLCQGMIDPDNQYKAYLDSLKNESHLLKIHTLS